MSHDQTDIVIVGAGITGCALYYELSKLRIGKILSLDSGQIANGITRQSGGFIYQFALDSVLQRRQRQAFNYFQHFQHRVGYDCAFRQTGLISRVSIKLLEAVQSRIIDLHTGQFPISWNTDSEAVYINEPRAGKICPMKACQAWVKAGKRYQGQNLEFNTVTRLLGDEKEVWGVETSLKTIHAKLIILAAGPAIPLLTMTIGLDAGIGIKSFQYLLYHKVVSSLDCAYIDYLNDIYILPLRNGKIIAGFLSRDIDVRTFLAPTSCITNTDTARELHALIAGICPALAHEEYSIHASVDAFENEKGVDETKLPHGLLIAPAGSGAGVKVAPAAAQDIAAKIALKFRF